MPDLTWTTPKPCSSRTTLVFKGEDGVDRGGRGVHHRPRQQLRAVWTQSRQEGQDYRPPERSCHQEPDIHLHYHVHSSNHSYIQRYARSHSLYDLWLHIRTSSVYCCRYRKIIDGRPNVNESQSSRLLLYLCNFPYFGKN